MQNGVLYPRFIYPPRAKSFFFFGPRKTGKTTWVKSAFPKAVYIDLLEVELFNDLTVNPQRLSNFIPPDFKDWVIIDGIQRIPDLLHEVHRLIETKKISLYSHRVQSAEAEKKRSKSSGWSGANAFHVPFICR